MFFCSHALTLVYMIGAGTEQNLTFRNRLEFSCSFLSDDTDIITMFKLFCQNVKYLVIPLGPYCFDLFKDKIKYMLAPL